jgi:hypothetical protein
MRKYNATALRDENRLAEIEEIVDDDQLSSRLHALSAEGLDFGRLGFGYLIPFGSFLRGHFAPPLCHMVCMHRIAGNCRASVERVRDWLDWGIQAERFLLIPHTNTIADDLDTYRLNEREAFGQHQFCSRSEQSACWHATRTNT